MGQVLQSFEELNISPNVVKMSTKLGQKAIDMRRAELSIDPKLFKRNPKEDEALLDEILDVISSKPEELRIALRFFSNNALNKATHFSICEAKTMDGVKKDLLQQKLLEARRSIHDSSLGKFITENASKDLTLDDVLLCLKPNETSLSEIVKEGRDR